MPARLLPAMLISLFAMTAFAHSTVKSTVPASGSILTASPPEVVINFNEPARLVSVLITSVGAAERKLQFTPAGEAASFTIAAPALANGRNEIKWRALSRDGHPINGTIILVVKSAAAPASAGATP
jgi:copper resistance protein C